MQDPTDPIFFECVFSCSCQESIQLDSDSDQEPTGKELPAVPKASRPTSVATAVKSAPPPAPPALAENLSQEDWKRKYEELLAALQQQAPATPPSGVFTPGEKKQVFTPTPAHTQEFTWLACTCDPARCSAQASWKCEKQAGKPCKN